MRKGAPLSVDVPSADRDTPGWIKVGIIAVVGFAVGVAWPRVTGVRLGPNPPGETASNARASSPDSSQAASTKVAAPKAALGAPSPAVASAGVAGTSSGTPANPTAVVGAAVDDSSSPSRIRVQRGAVLSCRTSGGDTKKGSRDCGALPSLDAYVAPRIRKLSTCAAAAEASGKLSLVVGADFATDKITWEIGKSTTITPVEGVRSCLDTLFKGASASGIAHEHTRYTVAYASTLGDAPSSGKADEGDKRERTARATDDGEQTAPRARDESTIRWENATVRDAPRTGQIVAQLPRGTKVKIGAAKDGWYPVKFGDGFTREGWIHRSAFGSP